MTDYSSRITWTTSTRLAPIKEKARAPITERVRVHPYSGTVFLTSPREEIKRSHKHRRNNWPCRRLSDLEIAGIIFALIGLAFHISSMATPSWASYIKPNGDVISYGIFPQCQFLHGCVPVGPVGGAAIVAAIYGASVPVLFTIYTTCCWRQYGGRYVEYVTTANCFVATIAILASLLMAGLRLWDFPLLEFELDYSYFLDLGAGFAFLIAGILFLVHVCLQWE